MGEAILTRRGGIGGGKIDVTVTPLPEMSMLQAPINTNGIARTLAGKFNDGSVIFIPSISGVELVNANRYYVDGHQESVLLYKRNESRSLAGVATRGDGKVVVAGGKDHNSNLTATAFRIDENNVIVSLPKLSEARHSISGATDGYGRVVFIGGNYAASGYGDSGTIDKYDQNDVLITSSKLTVARQDAPVGTFGDGSIGVFGGTVSGNYTDSVNRINLDGTVSALPNLKSSYNAIGAGIGTLGDGRILLAGGYASLLTPYAEVWAFDSNGNKTKFPDLQEAKLDTICATDPQGRVLAIGGYKGSVRTTVDRYSSDGTKEVLSNLSTGVRLQSAANMGDGSIITSGGDASYPTYRFNGGKRMIGIPAHNAFRFYEDSTEQPPFSVDTNIVVLAPNSGYFKQKNGAITL